MVSPLESQPQLYFPYLQFLLQPKKLIKSRETVTLTPAFCRKKNIAIGVLSFLGCYIFCIAFPGTFPDLCHPLPLPSFGQSRLLKKESDKIWSKKALFWPFLVGFGTGRRGRKNL
jgi:hypothetical protein